MTFARAISIAVLLFMAYLMWASFDWVMTIPHEVLGMHHAGLIGAVYAPVAGIFKFAFDFVSDGKVDSHG